MQVILKFTFFYTLLFDLLLAYERLLLLARTSINELKLISFQVFLRFSACEEHFMSSSISTVAFFSSLTKTRQPTEFSHGVSELRGLHLAFCSPHHARIYSRLYARRLLSPRLPLLGTSPQSLLSTALPPTPTP
jgi:hypothetical protein